MKIKMSELREGDKILVPATVTRRITDGGSVVVRHESLNEFLIYRDCDIQAVTHVAVKPGDCIVYENANWGVVESLAGGYVIVWRFNDRDKCPDVVRAGNVTARKPLPAGYEWPRPVPK